MNTEGSHSEVFEYTEQEDQEAEAEASADGRLQQDDTQVLVRYSEDLKSRTKDMDQARAASIAQVAAQREEMWSLRNDPRQLMEQYGLQPAELSGKRKAMGQTVKEMKRLRNLEMREMKAIQRVGKRLLKSKQKAMAATVKEEGGEPLSSRDKRELEGYRQYQVVAEEAIGFARGNLNRYANRINDGGVLPAQEHSDRLNAIQALVHFVKAEDSLLGMERQWDPNKEGTLQRNESVEAHSDGAARQHAESAAIKAATASEPSRRKLDLAARGMGIHKPSYRLPVKEEMPMEERSAEQPKRRSKTTEKAKAEPKAKAEAKKTEQIKSAETVEAVADGMAAE